MSVMGIFRQVPRHMYENIAMDSLPDMHDGFFDGLWISESKSAHLFLRTYTGERSTIVVKDLERVNVSNFKPGNIIFDVVLVGSVSAMAMFHQQPRTGHGETLSC